MTAATKVEGSILNTVRDRIGRALQAGLFGQAVTVMIQLVSVPLFIRYWGVDRYGEWLILAAIPSYLALSDLGFASAAANEMTMSTSAGDRERTVATYQSTWALLGMVSIAVLALVPVFGFATSQGTWLGIRTLSPSDIFWTILLLGAGVCVSMLGGIVSAVYRCEGRFATSVIISNILRLAEFTATAGVVLAGAGVVALAATMLTVRCIGTVTIYLLARSFAPWAKIGLRHASKERIRALASPALSFMAFPLGNALNQQGFLLVIGAQLGPTPVVVFSTLRTISRVAAQAMSLINSSVWPELSSAFGRKDVVAAREIHRHACQASIAVAAGALIVLAVSGSWLLQVWTGGAVVMNHSAYLILLGGMAVNAVWFTSSVVPVSVNKHQRMALVYALASAGGLLLGVLLSHEAGLPGAAAATLIIELVMALFVLPNSLALTHDQFSDFCRSMIRWPGYLRARPTKS